MLTFVAGGGGNEVGGSFYCEEFESGEVLTVDCGGRPYSDTPNIEALTLPEERRLMIQRLMEKKKPKKPFPKLVVVPRVDYLLVSHGHYDHIGAVPLLVKKNPKVRIFATSESKYLMRFQWETSLRVTSGRGERPPYGEADIEAALQRVEIVPATDEFTPPVKLSDNLSFVPVRAGHILGAVSYFIIYKGEIVGFNSGDISYQDQKTVRGAPRITLDGIRFAVVDSTRLTEKVIPYGVTDQEIVKRVRDAIYRGVSVRFLVFAIGRAQEAWEIIREAFPNVPRWMDGAACKISNLYLERLPKSFDPDIGRHFIRDDAHRREVVSSMTPNIVVVPSAMQFGGYSRDYIREGIENDRRLFVSLGWIDPCSPEYAFFESDMGDAFRIDGITYGRLCDVARFNRTAHCGGDDVLAMRERLKPDKTILVHGEDEKMDEFLQENPNKGFLKGENFERIVL